MRSASRAALTPPAASPLHCELLPQSRPRPKGCYSVTQPGSGLAGDESQPLSPGLPLQRHKPGASASAVTGGHFGFTQRQARLHLQEDQAGPIRLGDCLVQVSSSLGRIAQASTNARCGNGRPQPQAQIARALSEPRGPLDARLGRGRLSLRQQTPGKQNARGDLLGNGLLSLEFFGNLQGGCLGLFGTPLLQGELCQRQPAP